MTQRRKNTARWADTGWMGALIATMMATPSTATELDMLGQRTAAMQPVGAETMALGPDTTDGQSEAEAVDSMTERMIGDTGHTAPPTSNAACRTHATVGTVSDHMDWKICAGETLTEALERWTARVAHGLNDEADHDWEITFGAEYISMNLQEAYTAVYEAFLQEGAPVLPRLTLHTNDLYRLEDEPNNAGTAR